MIKKYIKFLRQLSIYRTIRFNLYYFGLMEFIKHGPSCFISKNVKLALLQGKVIIKNPCRYRIRLGFALGFPVYDRHYERFIWYNSGTVVFHESGELLMGCKIDNSGYLEFGKNICCNVLTSFICKKKILIGDNCLIGWRCLFMDTDYHIITDEKGNLLNPNQEISIENQVWIGCNAAVLKGTKVNTGSIIAAGSTICGKSFGEENIIIGEYGRKLKSNVFWNAGLVN